MAERGRWSQLLTSAYLEYWSGNHEAAFLQYIALAELGYEVAQSNVALLLEEGECATVVFLYAGLDCYINSTLPLSFPDDIPFIPDSERYQRALVYWKRSATQGSLL